MVEREAAWHPAVVCCLLYGTCPAEGRCADLCLLLLAGDVKEGEGPEAAVLVPGAVGLLGDGVPVHEGALVELLAGEVADGGVHAVLRAQHHHRVPRALQPLEQTRAVPTPRPPRPGVGKEEARGEDGTGDNMRH